MLFCSGANMLKQTSKAADVCKVVEDHFHASVLWTVIEITFHVLLSSLHF